MPQLVGQRQEKNETCTRFGFGAPTAARQGPKPASPADRVCLSGPSQGRSRKPGRPVLPACFPGRAVFKTSPRGFGRSVRLFVFQSILGPCQGFTLRAPGAALTGAQDRLKIWIVFVQKKMISNRWLICCLIGPDSGQALAPRSLPD